MTAASGARDLVAALMDGYLSTQLVYVAMRLGLADLLANGPQSADRLAAAAGADPSNLYRILRGLAMYGLLYQAEDTFGLTDAGRYLQSGVEDSLRGAILSRGDLYYHAASGLLHSAHSGSAAFQHVYGTGFSIISPLRPTGWSHSNNPWWLGLRSKPRIFCARTTSAAISM
jgi:Dimerisation domain